MRITLHPQFRTFEAAPGEAILDAALRAGVVLPHGCRGGNCGACRARLVTGEVDYPRGPPLGLAPGDVESGWALLCRAHARTDVVVEAREIRRAGEVEVKTLPCRVERVESLAPDVRRLLLRLPVVDELAFHAGQYLDVLLPGGVRRSYSIASPPHDASLLELHVGRKPGGAFTRLAFESLPPGALLRIEGPLGTFAYEEPAEPRPALLVAGGTGFAPLKSLLRHVLESGSRRALHLYWGARSAEGLYEHAWMVERVARFEQLRYVPVVSDPREDDGGRFRMGLVHEAVTADVACGVLAPMDVYAAGPPPMIEALTLALTRAGWPRESIRSDAFE